MIEFNKEPKVEKVRCNSRDFLLFDRKRQDGESEHEGYKNLSS